MRIYFVLLLHLIFVCTQAAHPRKEKSISVPFEVVGSYAVVKISVNGSPPLHFILDSGVRTTIITELSESDSLSLNYSENTALKGLGSGNDLKALISPGNTLQLGKLTLNNKAVYVLEEDIFNLSKHTGYKINGLIGTDLFPDHIVEINYTNRVIRFHDKDKYQVHKSFVSTPMTIEEQKMFIRVPITDNNGREREYKMLLDTGAELAAWLKSFGQKPIAMPEKRVRSLIGQGLSGEIKGYMARLSAMSLGGYVLKMPVVSFPDSATIGGIAADETRDGTLGSQILSRYTLIFDFSRSLLYLKPNYTAGRKFNYNIAGIELVQMSPFLRVWEVLYIWEGSSAEKAGVQVGDQLVEINGRKSFEMNINEIKALFETPGRRPLNVVLQRNDKRVTVKIDMKSAI